MILENLNLPMWEIFIIKPNCLPTKLIYIYTIWITKPNDTSGAFEINWWLNHLVNGVYRIRLSGKNIILTCYFFEGEVGAEQTIPSLLLLWSLSQDQA